MMGHHERPRAERHEFPGQQERERVVREDHEIHAGEKHREERQHAVGCGFMPAVTQPIKACCRSEEHTSELQSPCNLVCRLLLEKKKKIHTQSSDRATQKKKSTRYTYY